MRERERERELPRWSMLFGFDAFVDVFVNEEFKIYL